jgi:hypothetical protein
MKGMVTLEIEELPGRKQKLLNEHGQAVIES